MTARFSPSRLVRLLPIAALGLLMVLPGAALLGSAAGSHASPQAPGAHPGRLALTAGPAQASTSPLQGIPERLLHTPWIASLAHQGPHLAPLTSLPNLALLRSPPPTNGPVNPFYVAQPAPLGVTDFGLGATTYSYNVSHLLGQVTFQAPPNVTDPASSGVIEPAGQSNGYVGSVYEFGIQLNTVATNISIPGSDQGFFWTQNVVNWNDSGIHFVDDTFNLTSATQNPFFIAPGTILAGCHTNAAGVQKILTTYGGVFQCVGGTIPLSPASYPVTIQLYNNATINSHRETQVTYGYHIDEAGTGKVYGGISDTVVFQNPTPFVPPANRPGFSIDGFSGAPSGLFRDAEIDLVGDIGGDNAVFRAVSGSINLEYSNASSGGFRNVPSAYNFGGDTGETSTGIADYWTTTHAGHTEVINQGPAMLYGLWGAVPGVSVHSGAIHLAGSIHPSYGFVFVSNTPPVLDPWGTGARDNLSWLPTTDAGTFNTWLPPPVAPWTSRYYVQAFAAGSAEVNGTPVTHTNTAYTLTLPSAPGVLRAPLYMFSNAQAAGLAKNVTGSAVPPFDFNGLTVNVNTTFNHLNDYGFPTFVLLMAASVTHPVLVNNTYQGPDSPNGTFYLYDFAGPSTGILVPGPANSTSLPMFTSGIAIYDGVADRVTNQTLASDGYGLQLVLWQDTGFQAQDLTSELFSSGVWVGDSVGTSVQDVTVFFGGTGITDIGSRGTTGSAISVTGAPSLGVEGLSSSGGSFSGIQVLDGATGLSTGDNFGASAAYDPYYYLPGTSGLSVRDLSVAFGSLGANFTLSDGTTVGAVTVWNQSVGITFDDSPSSTVRGLQDWNQSTGVNIIDSRSTTVVSLQTWNSSVGVYVNNSHGITISTIAVDNRSTGVSLSQDNDVKVTTVRGNLYSVDVQEHLSTSITINHLRARGHSIEVYTY